MGRERTVPRQPGGLRPASQPDFAPADPPAPRFPGGPPAGRPTGPKSPAGGPQPQARRPEPSRASDRFSVISRHRGRRAARTTARDALRRLRAGKEPGLYAAKEQPIRLRGVARREVVVEALRRRRARAAAVLVRGGVLARELRVRDAAAVHEHDVEGLGELREGVERVAELRRALRVVGARRRVRPGRGARSADEHRRRRGPRRALRRAARGRVPPRRRAAHGHEAASPRRGRTSRRSSAGRAAPGGQRRLQMSTVHASVVVACRVVRREAPKRKITRVYAPWRLRGQRIHAAIVCLYLRISSRSAQIPFRLNRLEPARAMGCDRLQPRMRSGAQSRALSAARARAGRRAAPRRREICRSLFCS